MPEHSAFQSFPATRRPGRGFRGRGRPIGRGRAAVSHSSNRRGPSGTGRPGPGQFGQNMNCYNCNHPGHRRFECPNRNRTANVVDAKLDSYAVCFSAGTQVGESDQWYLDSLSGASEHLVTNELCLQDVKVLQNPITIRVAKEGQCLKATKVGNVLIKTLVDGKVHVVKIENVLFAPGLCVNLLSVKQLRIRNFKVIFENGKASIVKNGVTWGIATRGNFLYKVETWSGTAQLTQGQESNLWHHRLGHIGESGLSKLDG